MADVSWSVDTSPDGTVTADYLVGQPPTVTRGGQLRVRVGFDTSSPYTTLRDYIDFAGVAATFTAIDGRAFYREHHTSTHELLMGFNPDGADIPSEVEGWWGILTAGRDRTPSTVTGYLLEMQFFVLEEYSTHASRADAKTAHEK